MLLTTGDDIEGMLEGNGSEGEITGRLGCANKLCSAEANPRRAAGTLVNLLALGTGLVGNDSGVTDTAGRSVESPKAVTDGDSRFPSPTFRADRRSPTGT